ncbi:MAG: TetR/AcrR family transcriptional regulator [Armatimonadetes bacterium]|nr:TetR/AcrR family transcriptional regulator [Armatimonadota bacterium]
MSLASRKEKEFNIRKNDIIEAARELFFTKGFRETTMENIAQKAEFTKKTLYSYFLSKYDLYFAVIIQSVNESSHTYDETIENRITGIDKLHAFADRYFKCYKENPQYFQLLKYKWEVQLNLEKVSPILQEERNRTVMKNHTRLFNVFEIGKKDDTIRTDIDIKIAVEYFMSTLQTICSMIFFRESKHDSFFYMNLDFLLRSFKA